MKLVSISNNFFTLCSFDQELLTNRSRRPHVIVLKLKYKLRIYDFAIPFRSNIPKNCPKHLYFSLPPRPSTKQYNKHGLHYVKMFPVKNEYLEKFHTENDKYYDIIKNRIKKNLSKITQEVQLYLDNYSAGKRELFSTDIDGILNTIF